MPGSSFPKRAGWTKLLPGFSSWSAIVGLLLNVMSLILTGISGLTWWTNIAICLTLFVVSTLAYAVWKIANVTWQRVKQYNLLYDDLEELRSQYQQIQENSELLLKILRFAGTEIFEVTGIEWGNKSPLLVMNCSQSITIGSKLAVINRFTLDILGRFEVVQPTVDGYLLREMRILNTIWWSSLCDEMAKYAHPRIVDAVAVLLH